MILVLTIVLLLFGLFVRQMRSERRQLDLEERKAQLAWLAQAGLERASYRLFSEPDYQGETWTIAAEWISSRHPADVRITVGPLPGKPGARRVTVVAHDARDAATPLRASLATRVDLSEGARSR
jgi:hypothetical protein